MKKINKRRFFVEKGQLVNISKDDLTEDEKKENDKLNKLLNLDEDKGI